MNRAVTLMTIVGLAGCGGAPPTGSRETDPPGARERSAATQQPGGMQVGTTDPARAGGHRFAEEYDYEPLLFSRRVGSSEIAWGAGVRSPVPPGAPSHIAAFTAEACRGVPPASRSACPLLVAPNAVEPAPGGFLVSFAPWVDMPELLALMRCHQAFAAATGFSNMPFCPLYVPELHIERRGRAVFFGITTARREELERRLDSHIAREAAGM